MKYTAVIPLKLPGLNEYVRACRSGPYVGAKMKEKTQRDIGWYLLDLPEIRGPVEIRFTWVEKTRRRDFDNVAFAKKFILDELVQLGKLEDDSRRFVKGFTDSFQIGDDWSVVLEIAEVENDHGRTETGPEHYLGYKGRSLRRRRPSAPSASGSSPAGGARPDDGQGSGRRDAPARDDDE